MDRYNHQVHTEQAPRALGIHAKLRDLEKITSSTPTKQRQQMRLDHIHRGALWPTIALDTSQEQEVIHAVIIHMHIGLQSVDAGAVTQKTSYFRRLN
jgi:hypothetical protein